MRTKYTSGPPVQTRNEREFYFAGQSPRTTHHTNQGPGGRGPTDYKETEQRLFPLRDDLVDSALLKVALKHSNNSIIHRVAAAAAAVGLMGFRLSSASISDRINNALQAQARAKGITLREAQMQFSNLRIANGVRTIAFDGDERHSFGGIAPSTLDGEATRQAQHFEEDFGGILSD